MLKNKLNLTQQFNDLVKSTDARVIRDWCFMMIDTLINKSEFNADAVIWDYLNKIKNRDLSFNDQQGLKELIKTAIHTKRIWYRVLLVTYQAETNPQKASLVSELLCDLVYLITKDINEKTNQRLSHLIMLYDLKEEGRK